MEHALVTLNSLADAEPTGESVKKRDAVIRSYISSVHGLLEDSKSELLADPGRAFEVLNPAQNSIGYMHLLDLVFRAGQAAVEMEKEDLLDKIVHFITRFDPLQIRYIGPLFRSLLERISSGSLFPPVLAVELLAAAILRVQPAGSMLTSTHYQLAKLAVESNVLEPALKVLDKDITSYPSVASPREARDKRPWCDDSLSPAVYISTATGLTESLKSPVVLEYNFLRSQVYISRRDWDKAFAALEQVVTHPAKERGVSKIMVECHKRWLLVGLLKSGKTPSLPSYTGAQPKATYTSLSAPYKDLATLFASPNAVGLKTQAEQNAEIWQEDGTASLVAEVLSAYQKWRIINLRDIFTQVSVGQVRQLTRSGQTGEPLQSDEDVVSLIQSMLDSGMLSGRLDVDGSAGNFLHFGEASSVLSEEDFAREIATSHARITALNQQYKDVNDRLSEKKEYVRYMAAEQKKAEKEGVDPGIGFDSQVEDEDLMTGIMAHG